MEHSLVILVVIDLAHLAIRVIHRPQASKAAYCMQPILVLHSCGSGAADMGVISSRDMGYATVLVLSV